MKPRAKVGSLIVNADSHDVSEADINDEYNREYNAFLTQLTDQTPNTIDPNNLNAAGLDLLNAVHNDKSIDPEYRLRIVKAAKNLHADSTNITYQNNFINVMKENTSGKFSASKAIGGIGLIFLGAALIAASIFLGITTFGLGSPLTIGGIILGATFITGGGLLCADGAERGLEKSLQTFRSVAGVRRNGLFKKPISTKTKQQVSLAIRLG